jgi:NAD-dependent deacetylase
MELAALVKAARRILAFTGAGISTGSGIPDFRGPKGVWKRRSPVYFDDFLASEDARVEYWDGKSEAFEAFIGAAPNAAHRALVELDRAGRLLAVVTQNIDGLHELAAHAPERILELHGTNRWVECLGCGARTDPAPPMAAFRATRACPRCACGGLQKFATVSFGQSLPTKVLRRAFELAEQADLVLSLGSTLSVSPANQVPLHAATRGTAYVVINQGETEHDGHCTLRIEGDVSVFLPPAVAAALG